MTNIILTGCNGHMGRTITQIVKEDPDANIVAGIDIYNEVANDYPVFSSFEECDVEADVIIDFSAPAVVDPMLDYVEKTGTPVVLCTTGLSKEQIERAKDVATRHAVLKSANMSVGINTLMKILKLATEVLSDRGYDIEIVEKHHRLKMDAPSGTALALADCINDAADGRYEYIYDRSQVKKRRESKELGISAVRGGTIVGEHSVYFAGTDEVIEIKHTATSKAVFGKGAVDAAKFLKGKSAGMYDMSDVIG